MSRSTWIKASIILGVGAGLVFFQNCGKAYRPSTPDSNANANSASTPTAPKDPLLGKWQSTCMTIRVGAGTAYQVQTFEFRSEATVTVTDVFFRDKNCTQKASQIVYTGVYKASVLAENSSEPRELDYSAIPQTVTPLDAQQVTSYRNENKCGTPNWELNSPMPAELCSYLSTNQYFDLVQVKDSVLRLGKITQQKDGTTSENRPVEIENQYSYSAVNDSVL